MAHFTAGTRVNENIFDKWLHHLQGNTAGHKYAYTHSTVVCDNFMLVPRIVQVIVHLLQLTNSTPTTPSARIQHRNKWMDVYPDKERKYFCTL